MTPMPELVSAPVVLLFWAVFGYLLGAVPFGMIFARLFGLGDLRSVGSGNIGATNVLRTGSKPAAALTLVCDAGKGAAALLVARAITQAADATQIAGFAAMLGHCYPIWLRFKGGKAVATFLGTAAAYAWPVGIVCCLVWLAAARASKISSVGALAASAAFPVALLMMGHPDAVFMGVLTAALVIYRHRANIARIRAGTEPRIGSAPR